jgi:hypothetical protein
MSLARHKRTNALLVSTFTQPCQAVSTSGNSSITEV